MKPKLWKWLLNYVSGYTLIGPLWMSKDMLLQGSQGVLQKIVIEIVFYIYIYPNYFQCL